MARDTARGRYKEKEDFLRGFVRERQTRGWGIPEGQSVLTRAWQSTREFTILVSTVQHGDPIFFYHVLNLKLI